MFKDELKQDIDRISPSPELLDKVSLMMNEQVRKPRPKPYVYALRCAGAAAAVCLIAFGAVRLGLFDGTQNIASEFSAGGAQFKAETAAEAAGAVFDGIADAAAEAPAASMPQEAMPETYTAAETTTAAATYAFRNDDQVDGAAEDHAPEPPVGAAEPIAAGGIVSEAPDGFADEMNDGERDVPSAAEPENTGAASLGAFGGDGIESEYRNPVTYALSDINGYFNDVAPIGSWYDEIRFYQDYTDIDKFFNLYSYMKHFGIDKQTAESVMRKINEHCISYGWGVFYSEEDIDVLLNGTKEEITEHFANSRTVAHNGKLYTVEWFDTHTADDYRAENIPPEKIRQKLDNMLDLGAFYDLGGFEEKIGEYIGEGIKTPAEGQYLILTYPRETVYTEDIDAYMFDRAIYTFEEAAARIARNDTHSLCNVKILETLPDAQTSLNFANGCTIYRVQVNDLLSGETYERNAAFAGTAEVQEMYNPIYQAGDEILCETEIMNGEMIIRDYPLCDVYDTPAGKAAYIRIAPMDTCGVESHCPQLDIVTTTQSNPARYFGVYDYEDFAAAFVNEIKANRP